ncbi:MAG: hypothetical protein GEV13_21555 [Rhodospirillales bacterium]|nr:hypothetical protein [Rhodospirillales bacterium]
MLVIPQRIGIVLSIVLFGLPALLLWATTGLLIPPLVEGGWAPQVAWFLAGALVFVPPLVAALAGAWAALPAPSSVTILNHLRVRRIRRLGDTSCSIPNRVSCHPDCGRIDGRSAPVGILRLLAMISENRAENQRVTAET